MHTFTALRKNTTVICGVILLCAFILITGCGKKKGALDGAPKRPPVNLHKVPNAVPRVLPLSKSGNKFKNKTNSYVAKNKRYKVLKTSKGYKARGMASWYGTYFHGKKTSSGERYNMYEMTAAHPHLPLPTFAKVTNLQNGKSIIVKINDRGPFRKGRLIDLSYVAAHKLGMLKNGEAKVEVESIDPRDHGMAFTRKKLAQSKSLSLPKPKTKPSPKVQNKAKMRS